MEGGGLPSWGEVRGCGGKRRGTGAVGWGPGSCPTWVSQVQLWGRVVPWGLSPGLVLMLARGRSGWGCPQLDSGTKVGLRPEILGYQKPPCPLTCSPRPGTLHPALCLELVREGFEMGMKTWV